MGTPSNITINQGSEVILRNSLLIYLIGSGSQEDISCGITPGTYSIATLNNDSTSYTITVNSIPFKANDYSQISGKLTLEMKFTINLITNVVTPLESNIVNLAIDPTSGGSDGYKMSTRQFFRWFEVFGAATLNLNSSVTVAGVVSNFQTSSTYGDTIKVISGNFNGISYIFGPGAGNQVLYATVTPGNYPLTYSRTRGGYFNYTVGFNIPFVLRDHNTLGGTLQCTMEPNVKTGNCALIPAPTSAHSMVVSSGGTWKEGIYEFRWTGAMSTVTGSITVNYKGSEYVLRVTNNL